MGNRLFSKVTELTGLPTELIAPELSSLLENKGVAPDLVTLDTLRTAMMQYLQEVSEEIERENLQAALLEQELVTTPAVRCAQ